LSAPKSFLTILNQISLAIFIGDEQMNVRPISQQRPRRSTVIGSRVRAWHGVAAR
jgi:hypothetical protein